MVLGSDLVELVLVQEVLDLVALGLVVLVLVVTDLLALDQVDMGPALPGQDWVVLEPGQVVLDQVVWAQDQAAMDLVEQGPVLVFMLLEVKGWGRESHLNQVQGLDLEEQVLDLADMGLVVLGQVVLAQEQEASDQVVLVQEQVASDQVVLAQEQVALDQVVLVQEQEVLDQVVLA